MGGSNWELNRLFSMEFGAICDNRPGSRIVAVAFTVALTTSSAFQCQCRVSGTIFHWKGTGFWMKTIFFKRKFEMRGKINISVWEISLQCMFKMPLPYVLSFFIRKTHFTLENSFFNVKFVQCLFQ